MRRGGRRWAGVVALCNPRGGGDDRGLALHESWLSTTRRMAMSETAIDAHDRCSTYNFALTFEALSRNVACFLLFVFFVFVFFFPSFITA